MTNNNPDPAKLRRIVFATSMGTVFEAYDFILFGSLAPVISVQFFAGVNETAAFIFALLTFAAGYVIRPLGALFFGSLGDRTGRKRAFLITITLMGAATFAIGLLPTYAMVGILAPVLLIAMRLIQGLAFGGEYGGAVVYTAEHAPQRRRGFYVSWIQAAAGFALFMSFFVIWITRSLLGEEAFNNWGWRIPFLLSIVLLAISLWMRLRLEESPLFQQMLAEGKAAKQPLRETFAQWQHLKLVLLVLFGLLMGQGVIYYTAHFYSQFFLMQLLDFPAATMTLIMMIVTFISVPLYLAFGWLSDQIGRKPIILTGTILMAITAFPIFYTFTAVVNPALAEAQQNAPVTVHANPAQCSLQFDPVGQTSFTTSCDIAKSTLAALGISYTNTQATPGTVAYITIGTDTTLTWRVTSIEGATLDEPSLLTAREDFRARLLEALTEAGYPSSVNLEAINLPLLTGLMLALIVFAAMVYAPAPTMALEIFPTRIRYTGLSLPYHIGAGWFGGFLPAIAFSMVAANGSIYFGLWYPVVMITITILVLAFFLPETRGQKL
ncbi:MAG: MFS transporter [Pseudohongiellaceae bacterium]